VEEEDHFSHEKYNKSNNNNNNSFPNHNKPPSFLPDLEDGSVTVDRIE